ncbi:MAG TPA: GNAT family N-acetyltransferase [Candidatus Angelobacter sp.]|nr:GNAT family N-acetyltransferase [Candidatus Angelobacter sp.]
MDQGVILETERLLLREVEPTDTDALLQVLGDPIAMQYYPAPFSRSDVEDWIRRNRARYRDSGFGLWAILLKGSGELMGDCGFFVRDVEGDFDFELGWHVRRDLWGRGYATEAARACIDCAFSRFGAERVIALIRPENLSSCRVAEKNGMRCERIIFWRGYNHRVYVKQNIET